MSDFRTGFLWGSATVTHQVEGNNTNSNWWAFERARGSPIEERSSDAIDDFNRFDSDFAVPTASVGTHTSLAGVVADRR